MRFVAIGVIRCSGFPANGNSAVAISKVGQLPACVRGAASRSAKVERVVSNALEMRLLGLIFAPSAMPSLRQRRANPPQHRADGSMQRWFNGC
jgi:hypothetical protein